MAVPTNQRLRRAVPSALDTQTNSKEQIYINDEKIQRSAKLRGKVYPAKQFDEANSFKIAKKFNFQLLNW